ncbi:MAG: hypothetical protein J0M19_09185 [Sphingomonadales bacterium]|nr:hypothetical protein [Sphingomonadales bacterium]
MSTIAPILNSLSDFGFSVMPRASRFEALQPMPDNRGNLDLGRFLTAPGA